MKVNGTGGYAGSIPYARLAQDVADGFVSAGSNMGHDGGESATWTLNRPEKVKDWGLRAHYSVATAAKALSNAFYAEPVRYSYFEGCSNGGRQALMMAQNYPELFDGIVAGAPSNFYPDLLMWLLWTGKNLTPSAPFGPPSVSTAKRQAVTQRVLQACDAIDGLADGQITNPRACRFDIDTHGPERRRHAHCAGACGLQGDVRGHHQRSWRAALHRRAVGLRGRLESAVRRQRWLRPVHRPLRVLAREPAVRLAARHQLLATCTTIVKQTLTPVTAAPSPDLRAFTRRGGKIIQYHGWNDSVVPPDGSIGYYYALTQFEWLKTLPPRIVDKLIDDLSPQAVEATALAFGRKVREYHRLFMLPAVGHCGGSTGPSAIGGGVPEPPKAFRNADTHVVSAVIKWVEQGVAPEKIVASTFDGNGSVVRQRPVCPYPAQAVYENGGDLNSADSFTCKTPRPRDIDVEAGDMLHIRNSLTQRGLLLPHR